MSRIHPTSFVSSAANVGEETVIGPFCVVESGVTLGARCHLESHVVIKAGTTVGDDNYFAERATIGGLPQHKQVPDQPGVLLIGHGNSIREHVTIHRGLSREDATRVGDSNLLMVNVHVAHDCQIGNQTILANNVMLAGHVTVGDGAYLSGAVGVHQFCRVGCLAMVGGQSHVTKDIPPFVTIDGASSQVVGLNVVGLRRAGWDRQQIHEMKKAYRVVFRSGLKWSEAIERLRAAARDDSRVGTFLRFLEATQRGCIQERRVPRGATLKLHVHGPEPAESPSNVHDRRASA